ncbi:MAG: hypothetical protein JSU57_00345 [Candidatus Heimdallarchaeota archaeon]|nr:MAG: hypothetical protein JSU57_00345 [Candidatus Heimdallarchaeota archaeon]
MEEPTKPKEEKVKKKKEYIKVRGYPETLFFYPSMIVAFIIFLLELLIIPDLDPSQAEVLRSGLGTFFFAVFAFNFIIVAFDFGLGKTALIAFAVIIIILVYLLVKDQIPGWDFGFDWPEITASMEFYFFFAALIFIHLIIIYIYSRIDYWLISPTEIYHHRGILGDERRFGNAQHAHIEKTTPDIFEKMLFLSGDIFVKPETDPHIYRIANVFRVNKKEEEIRKILSYVPDKRVEF